MGNGIRIAKEFGLLVPTKIWLDYERIKNTYKLTQQGAIHIPNVFPVRVKEEPIEIISDDEADIEQTNGNMMKHELEMRFSQMHVLSTIYKELMQCVIITFRRTWQQLWPPLKDPKPWYVKTYF
jgi:hypothetical protein